MSVFVGNISTTPRGVSKLGFLEYPEVFFLEAEFQKLKVFGRTKLEKSCKT
jgi:hypothetical protein